MAAGDVRVKCSRYIGSLGNGYLFNVTLALYAKLDELLRVDTDARTEPTRLDEQEPEAIQKHRSESNSARFVS